MGFLLEQVQIEQEFTTGWTHTPIAHDNVTFGPQALDEWVRFTDLNGKARQASLGNNPLYRYWGIVVVQIFVKPNIGVARALVLADFVTDIFRSKRISETQFDVPAVMRIGTRDGWYQINVDCPYYRTTKD